MVVTRTRKPATPRPRNARGEGEKLRGEIIDAAIRVLEALGPEDPFSLRSVAKAAKIAAPSVYIHFADRNALLLAVLEKLFAELVMINAKAETEAAQKGGGAWECLLARAIATVRFGLEHPGHYRVMFEGRALPRLNDPLGVGFGRPLMIRTIELISEIASQPGRVSEDPERLLLLLWCALHGVVSLRINKPTQDTLDWPAATEMAEQMIRAILLPKARKPSRTSRR